MGWASAGSHFNDVADALIEANASDEVITKVCAALITSLESGDWDTQGESLQDYQDTPAIVEAFRQRGHFVDYCEAPDPNHKYGYCRNEAGHTSPHYNRYGSWPLGE